jgi:spore cortex formation protein SpoVR/YcgB (stage V sporulation)
MMQDIRRICENPTDEDREWFPDIAGSDWKATLDHAMRNFKDESFILQYLSPRLMRELKLFSIMDDSNRPVLRVDAIHNERGYRQLREALSAQYNLGNREPNIQVWNVNVRATTCTTASHWASPRKRCCDMCTACGDSMYSLNPYCRTVPLPSSMPAHHGSKRLRQSDCARYTASTRIK